MIAVLFVIFVISGLFKASIGLIIGVAVLVVLLMVWSRRLKKQSILIERRFFQNLRSRDVRAEYLGEKNRNMPGVCCHMIYILLIWKFRVNLVGQERH